MDTEEDLIDAQTVADLLNRAINHVFRSVKENQDFPQPIRLNRGNQNRDKFVWRKSDIQAFVEKNPKYKLSVSDFKRSKGKKPKPRVEQYNPFSTELALLFITGQYKKKRNKHETVQIQSKILESFQAW